MLQKGFLKLNENTPKVSNMQKYLKVGGAVSFILGALIAVQQGGFLNLCLILVIVGTVMVSVSFWMDVFTQNKNRRHQLIN